MITLFEMPLSDVSTSDYHKLQSKYPSATLRIEVDDSPNYTIMDETQFWGIIDLLDWRTMDSDAILAPSIEALSYYPKVGIQAFHDILNKKLML